jgi:hypothetical protein
VSASETAASPEAVVVPVTIGKEKSDADADADARAEEWCLFRNGGR